jgi:hypothetical protein
MHLFIRLRVTAHGPRHTSRWHQGSSYAIILPLVTTWTAKFLAHFPADHDKDPLGLNESMLQPDLNPKFLLRTDHRQLTRAFFDERISRLRRKLHGRLRTQLRLKMSERVRKMQLCLEQNKIRDVLLKLGNKQRGRTGSQPIPLRSTRNSLITFRFIMKPLITLTLWQEQSKKTLISGDYWLTHL